MNNYETYGVPFIHWLIVAAVELALVLITYQVLTKIFKWKPKPATGFALVVPNITGVIVWLIFPFVFSLYMSFTDYNMFQSPNWVGLDNYKFLLFDDPTFWPSLRVTLIYAVLSVPLSLGAALGVALILNRDVKAVGFWRTLYYVPSILPPLAVTVLWRFMFAPDKGIVDVLLSPFSMLFHIGRLDWYEDPNLVLTGMIIMGLWSAFGVGSVTLLAGLKSISPEYYEAANLEGAGMLRKFWHITVPMLSPTLFYNLVLGTIGALQIFMQSMFMPMKGNAQFVNWNIWKVGFEGGHFGLASAMSWLFLIVVGLFTLLTFKSSGSWVYYEGDK